jgi:uncharacterized repeat protein (TIGR03803 family)
MKPTKGKFTIPGLLVLLALIMPVSGWALEPQTLFNFQLGLGTVKGALIEGPDGNFYGTTANGGPMGSGTVFRVTPAGVLTVLVSDQANPAAGLAVGNDGLLYGMTGAGGAFGFGTVFKLRTNGVLTSFAVLDGVNGGNPQSGLVLADDGNFYGTSQEGGTNGIGAVFRVTPGGVVTSLVSFDAAALGGFPVAGLAKGPDGNLYGVTTIGGIAGRGTIFKITTGGIFTTLHSFQGTDGFVHQARLALGPDLNLYGTSRDGGSADMGAIFRITTNGVFTNVVSFKGTNGAVPFAEVTPGADGQLYGTTQLGGSSNLGTIFKVSTNGVLTTLVSFNDSGNALPQAGLLLASDGNYYGCSRGAVFKMTPSGVLTTMASLMPLNGIHPQAGLTPGPDGNFYGTTRDGGTNNFGTIFRLTAEGVLTSLFAFGGTNGSAPQAGLTLGQDGNFYGTTTLGGSSFLGTIFRFSTNGTLTTLVSFNGTNGANPQCQLVMDAAGNFYGTAPKQGPGGFNGSGTVFRVTTDGVLSTLIAFNNTNGAFADDGLTVGADGNFYGTTANGGSHSAGTVFRITPAGALTTLVSFNNTNGAFPLGGLVLGPDGNLYGTTGFGGTNLNLAFGTLFRVTTNGALTTLFSFHFTDGSEPAAKMIFGRDGNLYGTTTFGGVESNGTGLGTVFRLTTNGLFTPLLLFQGTNGSGPQAPLALGLDGNLYGTTANGGTGGGGTIFRIVLTPQLAGIAKAANGNVSISGIGPSGSAYRLWTSSDLSRPIASWTLLTNDVFAADGTFSFTDTAAAIPARFYRVSTP